MITLIYLALVGLYFTIGLGISIGFYRWSKRKHRWIVFIIFFFVYLPLPWSDLIIKKVIISIRTFNQNLQSIEESVEVPESVLWIDNVWPGFDEFGRHWMVKNYLDGVHLKTLVVNDGKGKFYLYHATLEDFRKSGKLRSAYERLVKEQNELVNQITQVCGSSNKERCSQLQTAWKHLRSKIKALNYIEKREEDVKPIIARAQIFESREQLPVLNYLVELNPIPLTNIERKLLWADKIKISLVQDEKVIAYSKRYMGYGWWPNLFTYSIFSGGSKKGDTRVYNFDDKVLFEYARVKSSYEAKRNRLDR